MLTAFQKNSKEGAHQRQVYTESQTNLDDKNGAGTVNGKSCTMT